MKVSVLLPNRNGGARLAECMHAVLDQDCSELELVVSDNANVDQTPEVLAPVLGGLPIEGDPVGEPAFGGR